MRLLVPSAFSCSLIILEQVAYQIVVMRTLLLIPAAQENWYGQLILYHKSLQMFLLVSYASLNVCHEELNSFSISNVLSWIFGSARPVVHSCRFCKRITVQNINSISCFVCFISSSIWLSDSIDLQCQFVSYFRISFFSFEGILNHRLSQRILASLIYSTVELMGAVNCKKVILTL